MIEYELSSAAWEVENETFVWPETVTTAATSVKPWLVTDLAVFWVPLSLSAVDACTEDALETLEALKAKKGSESMMKELAALGIAVRKELLAQAHFRRQIQHFMNGVAKSMYRARSGGNEWAYSCAYLSFVRDVIGWSCPEHEAYAHYENAALYGGVRFMHKKFCVVVDRPEEIHMDDNNRLHNEHGMARKYRDGTGLWYINGVAVTEQIVMHPETLTVEQIRDIENEEVKRIAIERFGWERYLSETNAEVIDNRVNEIEQTREALMSADGMRVLVCACPSTARVYALEVPEEIDTCDEAQRWLRGDEFFGEMFVTGAT